MPFANVAVPAPVHTAFTYRVPEGMAPGPGTLVEVPFRRRRAIGVCIDVVDRPPAGIDEREIRSVARIVETQASLSEPILKLVRWMSSYYCAPIGEVCRAALPARLLKAEGPKTTRPAEPLEIMPLTERPVELTAAQQEAVDVVIRSLDEGPAACLLEGITGSGKTEVYLRLFEELVARGRQGLLLVPEIGLTPQLTGLAAARFGKRVGVYHSGLTDAQRHVQWLRMRSGEIDVAIGTRSALFAPLPRLGAIVVDEEHDASYKQDDGVAYSARDGAVMRAHIEGVPIVLGSATPSLESLENVRRGRYRHCLLPDRPTGGTLPTVEVVDMRRARHADASPPGAQTEGMRRRRELVALSPALFDAIAETLARGEQALLFTGRRGFAGSLQCDACGEVCSCPNCDIALTPHRGRDTSRGPSRDAPAGLVLACHYCDYRTVVPRACPACASESLVPIGHGTERLEAELADFFPAARIARFDSDSAATPARRKRILDDMRRGRIDILVGTQMVTKGHDFPAITLVGVVSADVALSLPDFRAAERTFQLLTQVAGRAGRGDRPGRVIIQTRQPEHYSFRAAQGHDTSAFAREECLHRRRLGYPPYARIANIRLSSVSEEKLSAAGRAVAKVLAAALDATKGRERCALLGPAPAPLGRLRGRHRWQILIKTPSPAVLGEILARARPRLEETVPSGVRLSIDVDPMNLL